METKRYDLAAVLSVTTGFLLTEFGILSDIMSHLMGYSQFTHEIALNADKAKVGLLKQFPQLAAVDDSTVSPETYKAWLDEQVAKYGNEFDVAPLSSDDGGGARTQSPMYTLDHMIRPRVVSNGKTARRARRATAFRAPLLTRPLFSVDYTGRLRRSSYRNADGSLRARAYA